MLIICLGRSLELEMRRALQDKNRNLLVDIGQKARFILAGRRQYFFLVAPVVD